MWQSDAESASAPCSPWRLPLICQRLAQSGKLDAVIALGCVIRGATPHFEYVAGEAYRETVPALKDRARFFERLKAQILAINAAGVAHADLKR